MVPCHDRVRVPEPIFTPYDEIMRTDDPGSEWNRLALTGRQQDPFCCTTAWNLSFHEAFSPKRRLLVRSSDGNVVSFAEKVFALTTST